MTPRTFRRKEGLSALSQINVTPLIDLAFALLILFMIAAPLLEQTIPIELPLEQQGKQANRSEVVIQSISVDHQGHYYWGEELISTPQLKERLKALSKQTNTPVLHIRGNAQLPYQKIVDLMTLIKQNNLTKISLDTQAQ